jgi:putative glutamine amidotransferase
VSRPPRIGLTTYREVASWGVWHELADVLPTSYAAGIAAAGGLPMLLPPMAAEEAVVETVLDGLHGLLLTGGADIDPAEYGAERDPSTGPARADRDRWEIALARAAERRGMPVLGVCRGMQVLAVVAGSRLVQHLPDLVGDDSHCPTPGVHDGRHEVRVAAGSQLAGIVGDRVEVATYHHQSVEALSDPLVATGWTHDGTIEALEGPVGDWTLGVQWHPEVVGGEELFEAFVGACRARSER